MKSINFKAISAIWRRQLGSLLGNPLGYVFILAFVLVSGGFLFIPDSYFARNIADFGPLLEIMPWLLVILLPAIAMGSWASERELGTDEQLLTMPLSETDAIIGKWLAVCSFFTLALLCSLCNVAVLSWLGNPDPGLTAANYIGWWFAGLAFAALGVFASSLVSLPAVAFVLGALLCAAVAALARATEWFDPFNRGLFSPARAAMAITAAALFIGLGITAVSSRRWSAARRGMAASGLATLAGIVVICFNLSVQIERTGVEADLTAERLSSLSDTSVAILKKIDQPVTLTAFISEQLPPELATKGKEVENILKVIDRKMGRKIKLQLYRPADALDRAGDMAVTHYGLKPKKVVVDTVTGKEEQEVFLGVSISSGAKTQNINHFDPGLSVEYELVRAIRMVAAGKKKVVGIVKTDIDMLGGFNNDTRQLRQDWEIVTEWKKQYEVRQVNLDVDVGADVDVLVVPQPSSLTPAQLLKLHDYIWEGRPALLMEDPLPLFSGPELGSAQPRKPAGNPMFAQMQENQEPKGDITKLIKALGISMNLSKIAWSDYNPSHDFRQVWPKSLVWSMRQKKSISDSPAMTGIDSLLFPWPGSMSLDPEKDTAIVAKPLASMVEDSPWGHNLYEEHFQNTFFGNQKIEPQNLLAESGFAPYLAARITGKMKRAWPPAGQTEGEGKRSAKDVNVILITDIDFAHDEFFKLYRNENDMLSEDNLKVLRDLRNVQFLSNAVDALAGDTEFLALRTRRPKSRIFSALEKVLADTQGKLRKAEEVAQVDADAKIAKLQAEFQIKLDRIGGQKGLDDNAKAQLRAQVEQTAQRQLNADIEEINLQKSETIKKARIIQQREVRKVRNMVRELALGLPSAALLALAGAIYFARRRNERLVVPASRRRRDS